MDFILTAGLLIIVLSILVFVHEGGHYLAAKACGVRVTEFMLGLPGPRIGFTRKGTRFGVTAVPLGGYARVTGMEVGEVSPYLEQVLAFVYREGTVYLEDVAEACNIQVEEARFALDQLVSWGSIVAPLKTDEYNVYRSTASVPSERNYKELFGHAVYAQGEARPVADAHALFESERSQQFRFKAFWQRALILLAGPAVNLLVALVCFVIIYSVLGIDLQVKATGEVKHVVLDPLQAIMVGCQYIAATVLGVLGLFNPSTAGETLSQSSSLVGIAVLLKSSFEQGFINFLMLSSLISISLGIMNLIPIPPLDGGRFMVELYQAITRKSMSTKALARISTFGFALLILLFVFVTNQDIQRFILPG